MPKFNVALSRTATVRQIARIEVEAQCPEDAAGEAWELADYGAWETMKVIDSDNHHTDVQEIPA